MGRILLSSVPQGMAVSRNSLSRVQTDPQNPSSLSGNAPSIKLVRLMEERSKLLQEREDFLMVVTHDLKTPITAADRCLGLLLDGDFGELTTSQTELLSTMKDSNQRMFTMVKNLLEIYKYEQFQPILSLKEIDLSTCAETIVNSFSLSAQIRKIKLETKSAPDRRLVMANETAIQHVLTNLIDNAIKFTPNGGTISVSVRNVDAERVEIEVNDTGKGIAREDLPRIFQRFFQSESGRKQYTGTGLGLYLCKQIIMAHGGDIRCDSEIGVGTSFHISLPSV